MTKRIYNCMFCLCVCENNWFSSERHPLVLSAVDTCKSKVWTVVSQSFTPLKETYPPIRLFFSMLS